MSSDPFAGLPTGGFGVIAADPPWHFKTRSAKGEGRAPQAHYRTMSFTEIMDLPVATLAAPDCMLMLWTTGPHLAQAFDVLKAWRFRYVGIGFVWVKTKRHHRKQWLQVSDLHIGLGYTTRHNAELCLFARRGAPKRLRRNVHEIIIEPVREHSRKPERFYERAGILYNGPRLDMFSRQERDGWTPWGDQVGRFETPKLLLTGHAPTASMSDASSPPSSPSSASRTSAPSSSSANDD